MKKIPLHWQILIALILAVVVGLPTTTETMLFGVRLYDIMGFFGQMFMNALRMIVIPLVFASIVSGVASVAGDHGFGRLGAKTFVYYLATSLFSIVTGLTLVNLIQPGAFFTGDPESLGLSTDASEVMEKVGGRGFGDLVGVFLRMIPVNVFQAAAEGQFLAVIFFAGISPVAYVKAMLPAVLMAFSTASSSSTLPVTMECARDRVGASNRVSGFVLPLGATVNMDGTALYECVAVIFIAQVYGVELDIATQFVIVMLALLTSVGVAGVPAASLVAITLILAAVGLPVEAIALILAVDRVLDMCRTSVNVYSDACATGVVARSEKEKLLV